MHTTILDRILEVSSLLQQDMSRAFAGTELTETRVHALWVLQHHGELTQQALAGELGVTARSVSALVDGLERTGYLRRRPDSHDRRAVRLVLTSDAAAMMQRMQRDHETLSSTLQGAIAPEDREAFDRGLDAVRSQLAQLIVESSVHYGPAAEAPAHLQAQRESGAQ